jgi:hypothetical protein
MKILIFYLKLIFYVSESLSCAEKNNILVYFKAKNTLKNNNYHTLEHQITLIVII